MNNVQSQDRRTVGHKMLSDMLYDRFGTKMYKLSLTSGCTCPNRSCNAAAKQFAGQDPQKTGF